MSSRRWRRLGGILLSDLILVSHAETGVDGASLTFPNMVLGADDANRLIIVAGSFRSASAITLTNVTLGGVPITIDIEARNTSSGLSDAFIGHMALASGALADVVINGSGTIAQGGVSIYRTTKYNGAAPTKTGSDSRTNTPGTMSPLLTAPDLGFQIGVAFAAGGTNRKHTSASGFGAISSISVDCQDDANTWFGLREDIDATVEAGAAATMVAASAGWKYP